MTLHGVDTASDAAYTDAMCRDPSLTAFWPKVVVTGDEAIGYTAAAVQIERGGAPAIAAGVDLAERLPADALERRLRDKAAALVGRDAAEALWLEVAEPADAGVAPGAQSQGTMIGTLSPGGEGDTGRVGLSLSRRCRCCSSGGAAHSRHTRQPDGRVCDLRTATRRQWRRSGILQRGDVPFVKAQDLCSRFNVWRSPGWMSQLGG